MGASFPGNFDGGIGFNVDAVFPLSLFDEVGYLGPGIDESIAIRNEFMLSAGDRWTTLAYFDVRAVPEPEMGRLVFAALVVVSLVIAGRRVLFRDSATHSVNRSLP